MKQRYQLNSILIAPPFGQFFKMPYLSPVLGSYTLAPRAGRYTQALKTIRPLGKGNWVNKIGLRNPGIDNLPPAPHPHAIVSIAAVSDEDWFHFAERLSENANVSSYQAMEINLSCPNVDKTKFNYQELSGLKEIHSHLIVKLPPLPVAATIIDNMLEHGIKTFHLSNTYPTKRGGLSGKLLHRVNVRLISQMRKRFADEIQIIAGGGIQHLEDVQAYLKYKVNAVSLGTVCYTPWRLPILIKQIHRYLPEKIELDV